MKGRVPSELRLPDFIAVGPPRTGTTWLYKVLGGHVGLPNGLKETDFFAWEYRRGLQWYSNFFRNCSPHLCVGEIDPNYFDYPKAASRIAADIPGCRIVVTLRDPVDRVYSCYKMTHRIGLIDGPLDFDSQRETLAARASYADNVLRWWDKFGRDNVLILLYDDLQANAQEFVDRVCSFIGIASIRIAGSPFENNRINPSAEMPRSVRLARLIHRLRSVFRKHHWSRLSAMLQRGRPITDFVFSGGAHYPHLHPTLEKQLRDRFVPEVEQLERLLGRDLSSWKEKQPRSLAPREA